MQNLGNNKMLKHRFIKFELWNEKWITFNSMSPQRLQRLLNKHNPKNAYVSVNKFLNYSEHPTYKNQNILLERYGLIDIDGQDFESYEDCEDYSLEIIKFLIKNNVCIEEIVKTNSTINGHQILVKPCCYKDLSYLLKNHPQRFSRCDSRVYDLRRVRRMPNTYNGNKHSYSKFLYAETKDLNISKYLNIELSPLFPSKGKQPPLAGFSTLGMRLGENKGIIPVLTGNSVNPLYSLNNYADDRGFAEVRNPSPTKQQGRQEIKSNLPSLFAIKEMKSNVYGTKTLIPVFKFDKIPSKRIIKRLQALKLGNLYLFQTHKDYALISPKCCQMRQLEKVYAKVRCFKSLIELQKFRMNWITISNMYDLIQKKVIESLKFINFYEKDVKGWFSFPHLMFLNKFNKKEYSNIVGINPKIYVSIFKK